MCVPHLTHLCIAHRRERETYRQGKGTHVWGFVFVLLIHLYRGSFNGFSYPWGFPRINICVLLFGCSCLSFNDPFVYGYDVMMLNVIRSCITIKKLIVESLGGYILTLLYPWVPKKGPYNLK